MDSPYNKYLEKPDRYSYFLKTMLETGIPEEKNSFSYHYDGHILSMPYLDTDKEGNVCFYVQDIDGNLVTYTDGDPTDPYFKNKQEKPWFLRRFIKPRKTKDGLAKYMPCVPGLEMKLWFSPGIIKDYRAGTQFESLFMVEGYKKAIASWLNGQEMIGMNGLYGWKVPNKKEGEQVYETNQVRPEIIDLIKKCGVKRLVLIFDSDLMDFSDKNFSAKEPTTKRPFNFFNAIIKAKDLLSSLVDVVLVYPQPFYGAKGLDDLLLTFRNCSQIRTDLWEYTDRSLNQYDNQESILINDLRQAAESGTNGQYFCATNVSRMDRNELLQFFHLKNVQDFFNFNKNRLKLLKKTQFFFNSTKYNISEDYDEIEKTDSNDKDHITFIENGNCTYIKRPGESQKFIANFVMSILAVIDSDDDSKRIAKLTNDENMTIVISVSSDITSSRKAFRTACSKRSNHQFRGTQDDLDDWMLHLFKNEPRAIEIKQLGWDGHYRFYSFTNGLVIPEGFLKVDEYGMITYNDTTFYLAPYSKFTAHERRRYMEIRKFAILPAKNGKEISWKDFVQKMMNVFDVNGLFTINFAIRTMFGDIAYQKANGDFMLYTCGAPQTGKSTCMEFVHHLWGREVLQRISIGSGKSTDKYIMAKFGQIANYFVHLDEYKNDLKSDFFDMLKGLYDRMGYGKKAFTNDMTTRESLILCSAAISGEHRPTSNAALFSRGQLLDFIKQPVGQKRQEFKELDNICCNGITHFTVEILRHRELIEENWDDMYSRLLDKLLKAMRMISLEERLLKQTVVNLTPAAILIEAEVLDFGFSIDEMMELYLPNVLNQAKLANETSDLAKFWDVFQILVSKGILQESRSKDCDYRIINDVIVLNKLQVHQAYYRYMIEMNEPKKLNKSDWETYLKSDPAWLDFEEQNGNKCRFNSDKRPALYFNMKGLNIQLRAQDIFETDEQELQQTIEEKINSSLKPKVIDYFNGFENLLTKIEDQDTLDKITNEFNKVNQLEINKETMYQLAKQLREELRATMN
jgi:hypothetical protein